MHGRNTRGFKRHTYYRHTCILIKGAFHSLTAHTLAANHYATLLIYSLHRIKPKLPNLDTHRNLNLNQYINHFILNMQWNNSDNSFNKR